MQHFQPTAFFPVYVNETGSAAHFVPQGAYLKENSAPAPPPTTGNTYYVRPFFGGGATIAPISAAAIGAAIGKLLYTNPTKPRRWLFGLRKR
jgi:hypothetical protein